MVLSCPDIRLSPEAEGLFERIDPWVLYPPFLDMVVRGHQVLLDDGIVFYATQGWRSYEYQAKLYSYGRTDKSRGIVTKAKPGSSVHNFWGAIDFVYDQDPDKEGLQPSWNKKHYPMYKKLADAMVSVGLEAGYYWKTMFDAPHIQLPLRKHGLNTKKLKTTYKKGGKDAVFALLDQYDWTT